MLKIKTDSRKVKPNDTFVALRGISSDGHDYIESAINNGATTIIAEEGDYSVNTILVPDTRKHLGTLLESEYKKYLDEMTLIGVTGTNGKTTVSFLIHEALSSLNTPCAYIGTIGFYLDGKVTSLENTSPDLCDLYELLLMSYEKGYRHVALEVSSQGLSYGRFDNIEFDYAIFTNLTPDHLDYHITMENYADAKAQLFRQVKENGAGFINVDSEYNEYFKIGNYITYGLGESDYQLSDINLSSSGSRFKVNDFNIETPLIGKFNIYNTLCVIMILDKLKYTKEQIEEVTLKLKNPDGRMDIVKDKTNVIIIDYAHTADAMKNIYEAVLETEHNNIYVVFGCTGSRDRTKRPIMMQLTLDVATHVFVTSDDLHEEEFEDIVSDMLEGNKKQHYTVEKDRGTAIKKAVAMLKEKDILLILGKGHEEHIIVFDKKIPFNDKKEVMRILEDRK